MTTDLWNILRDDGGTNVPDNVFERVLPDSEEHVDVVKSFIGKGSDINAVDRNGRTPLMAASALGYLNLATLLIEEGPNVETTDNFGTTALHSAVDAEHDELAYLILQHLTKDTCLYDSKHMLHAA